MTTQAARIKQLMEARNIPVRKRRRALANASGAQYETVRQWFEKGLDNITAEYLVGIATTYNCDLTWLVSGRGEMDKGSRVGNGRHIDQGSRKIPVLSYIEAGDPKPVIADYMAGAGMDEVAVDSELEQELSMESFALVVSGSSMAPEFKEGDVVVIDPSVKPRPGDIVVATLEAESEATIKKYRSRGNDSAGHHVFELVPLNEDYHTITISSENPGHIVGTVVEHRRNLMRRR